MGITEQTGKIARGDRFSLSVGGSSDWLSNFFLLSQENVAIVSPPTDIVNSDSCLFQKGWRGIKRKEYTQTKHSIELRLHWEYHLACLSTHNLRNPSRLESSYFDRPSTPIYSIDTPKFLHSRGVDTKYLFAFSQYRHHNFWQEKVNNRLHIE